MTMKLEDLIASVVADKKLHRLIETTLPTLDGWTSVTKGCVLAGLVLTHKPKVVIELGVWSGRSLLPMAWAAKTYGGRVIGIDAWSAEASVADEMPANVEFWRDQKAHDRMYENTRHYIKSFGLMDTATVIRARTDDVNPEVCGLLHVDGNHMDQSVRDAQRYCPKVEIGGHVVFDDLNWTQGCVLRAVDVAEDLGFQEIYRPESGEQWNVMRKLK